MNNANGAALLARIKPGDLVTIRLDDGSLGTGRVQVGNLYVYAVSPHGKALGTIREDNIIKVEPKG